MPSDDMSAPKAAVTPPTTSNLSLHSNWVATFFQRFFPRLPPSSSTEWLVVKDRSLGFLSKTNPLRNLCLILTRSQLFDMFMLTNILVIFVILAAYQPLAANAQGLALPDPPQTAQDRVQTALEPWFQFIFSFEALVKIIALDAFGAHSYSSDGWNVFDFAVVVLCYLNYVPNTGNATALRTLRALRPLRSFGLVPALRRTFNGIMAVAYHEVRVEIIDWFLMFVVTLTGVQLWAGAMSGGCFYPDPFGSANVSTGRLNFASNTAGLIAGTDRTVVPGWVRNRFVNYLFYSAQDAAGVCGLQRATTGFAPGPADQRLR